MKQWKTPVAFAVLAAVLLAVGTWISYAQSPASQPAAALAGLPKPNMAGGMPLMEALKNRQTSRQFADKPIGDQVLSNLLWAACGVNRPDGKRTAPTAMNWQEIDVYVARADGLWLFDAKANDLKLVLDKDIRAQTGKQDFVKDAPVNLIFVADFARMGGPMAKSMTEADRVLYSAADTGFVSQNVYLFCASEGMATVVRGLVDRPALAKAMSLRDDQRIILTQSVGYAPAK
jgi:nitroreductase